MVFNYNFIYFFSDGDDKNAADGDSFRCHK